MKNHEVEESVIDDLYYSKREEFSRFLMKNSKEYQELLTSMEDKLKELINYVPEEKKLPLHMEIEDFMYGKVMALSEFWEGNYYRLGVIDGFKLKKEINIEMEEALYGKSATKLYE